jgi:Phytanoyl-CoA dioxygenase (PhyH)
MPSKRVGPHWDTNGFVVLPGLFSAEQLAPGLSELGCLFPSPDEFHGGTDQARNAPYHGDEYGGLVTFPFASVELCLLTVHPRLVDLARSLLGSEKIRIYSAEAWAKFTGAFDYEQEHHRDYLKNATAVPSTNPSLRNVEMFIYLNDVGEDLGPTHVVPTTVSADVLLTRTCASRSEYPQIYVAEVSAVGPAGTVLAYRGETLHRATNLTAHAGVRYSIHCSLRPAGDERVGGHDVADWSFDSRWEGFVARASRQQLDLFGFPPDIRI